MLFSWLMSVASQKTVSGFLHVAWRTAGDIARRVADRLRTSMPSAVRRSDGDRRGRDQPPQRPHVPDGGRRPRASPRGLGARRGRRGRVRPVLPAAHRGAEGVHQGGRRRRGPLDRLMRRPVVSERRTRARRLPHRLLDDRRLGQGPQTFVEPGEARRRREDDEAHARRQVHGPEEPRPADRTAGRNPHGTEEHGPQGPALPRMAAQGTIEDPAQTPPRPSQG